MYKLNLTKKELVLLHQIIYSVDNIQVNSDFIKFFTNLREKIDYLKHKT